VYGPGRGTARCNALDAFSRGSRCGTFNINDPNPGDRTGFPGIQSSATVRRWRGLLRGARDANVYAARRAHGGAQVEALRRGPGHQASRGAHVWSSPAVFNGKVYVGKFHRISITPGVRGGRHRVGCRDGSRGLGGSIRFPEHVCGDRHDEALHDGHRLLGRQLRALPGVSINPPESRRRASSACRTPTVRHRRRVKPPLGRAGRDFIGSGSTPERGAVYVDVGRLRRLGRDWLRRVAGCARMPRRGALPVGFRADPERGISRTLDFIASPQHLHRIRRHQPHAGGRGREQERRLLRRRSGHRRPRLAAKRWVAGGDLGGFNAVDGSCIRERLRRHLHRAAFLSSPSATTNGAVAWQCPTGGVQYVQLRPSRDRGRGGVFVGDEAGQLRAFDATDGCVAPKTRPRRFPSHRVQRVVNEHGVRRRGDGQHIRNGAAAGSVRSGAPAPTYGRGGTSMTSPRHVGVTPNAREHLSLGHGAHYCLGAPAGSPSRARRGAGGTGGARLPRLASRAGADACVSSPTPRFRGPALAACRVGHLTTTRKQDHPSRLHVCRGSRARGLRHPAGRSALGQPPCSPRPPARRHGLPVETVLGRADAGNSLASPQARMQLP